MTLAEELTPVLRGLSFGQPLYAFESLGSTNDEARRLGEAGAPAGTLVIADEQTAGRGRSGRTWFTPPGSAIAMSLILRPTLAHTARLTMLAGVAVCEAIEIVSGAPAALKWPNDVWLAGKKCAGILAESALRGQQLDYAILGIGINVSWNPPPEAVDFPATCVQAETKQSVSRAALVREVLTQLGAAYPRLNDRSLFEQWQARLATLGQVVQVQLGAETFTGRAHAVTEDGALLVRREDGTVRPVLAGEVRVRPV
jgi:BirA family biotin operon repressor/biotin-[acetyl-CoA-carboxylase] ligase